MNKEERDNVVKYRIERAKATLSEIETLIERQYLNNAVNRAY
jgi:Tfp pilus assembly protein PilE